MIRRATPTPCITLMRCCKSRAPLAGSILPPRVVGGSRTTRVPVGTLPSGALVPSSERASRTTRPPSGKKPFLAVGGRSMPKCVHCGREAECFDADDLPSCKRCARELSSSADRM